MTKIKNIGQGGVSDAKLHYLGDPVNMFISSGQKKEEEERLFGLKKGEEMLKEALEDVKKGRVKKLMGKNQHVVPYQNKKGGPNVYSTKQKG